MNFKIFSAALLGLFTSCALHAQSPQAASANEAAYNAFLSADYKTAATAYRQLLENYPTDTIFPTAAIQLAYCYYYLGDFQEAQNTLAKAISSPTISNELHQVADGFLPQIFSTQAATKSADSTERKAIFEKAVQAFSDYISKYPNAKDLENAIYNRAIVYFQLKKYDDVVKDMQLNIQKFPQSNTLASSKDLLALVLAMQGNAAIANGNTTQGFSLLDTAANILQEIINQKADLVLINDAYFQLAQILYTKAALSPDAEKPKLYEQALAAYRSIVPKNQIVAMEEEKIKAFPELKRQALLAKNLNLIEKLNKDNEFELHKLQELKAKPDDVASAVEKMGEIYFVAQKYNEARVVFNHVMPFLSSPEDQKRSLYFLTMTYPLQNAVDKAVTVYKQFMDKYKSDPLADNLPFVMGNMYLAQNNPSEAIHYFDESLKIYPNGRFAAMSAVSKAQAQTQTGQLDEAINTFQSFLVNNPSPEVAALAQSGLAGIYRDTKKWDEAIAAYKVIKEKYPNTPQANESDYWIAICTAQKGDNSTAIPLLQNFIKANENNPLIPMAMYALGTAQIATGKKEDGITTLTELAEKYPNSPPAPFTYFTRSQLRNMEQNTNASNTLMRQFIERYPKDDKVYFAYESLAKNAGKPDAVIAVYQEYVQNYQSDPRAATVLRQISTLQRGLAEALGRFSALTPEEQALWKKDVEASTATVEQLLKHYPESRESALALQELLNAQQMLLSVGLKTNADIEKYFKDLADAASSSTIKNNALFTLATYVSEKDKDRAFSIMSEAYDPTIVYTPQDLDFYGLALIDQSKLQNAEQVFEKLARDYPLPPNIQANQAPAEVQEAQASILFGKGRIAQEKGLTTEAGQLFEALKTTYPWSPKVLEANYGIAQSLKTQGKLDEATTLLASIIRAPTATASLRAKSMLLAGYIMVDKMNAATDQKQKTEYLGAAIDYFIKIAQFYSGESLVAAPGLWEGGQLLEQQANASNDPKFKAQQFAKAKDAYQQILRDYPTSKYTDKAQKQLETLGSK